jgi:hypothetical protein
MRIGSVWLPIVFCLVMAVCCGGPLLLGRWQSARRRPQHLQPTVKSRLAASTEAGQKERLMAKWSGL